MLSMIMLGMIVGGLYLVTALRKTGAEVKVYAKHQDLTQASKHHKQIMIPYSPLRRVSEPGWRSVAVSSLYLPNEACGYTPSPKGMNGGRRDGR